MKSIYYIFKFTSTVVPFLVECHCVTRTYRRLKWLCTLSISNAIPASMRSLVVPMPRSHSINCPWIISTLNYRPFFITLTSLLPSKLNVAALGIAYSVSAMRWTTVIPSRLRCRHSNGPWSFTSTMCRNIVPFLRVSAGTSMSSCLQTRKLIESVQFGGYVRFPLYASHLTYSS